MVRSLSCMALEPRGIASRNSRVNPYKTPFLYRRAVPPRYTQARRSYRRAAADDRHSGPAGGPSVSRWRSHPLDCRRPSWGRGKSRWQQTSPVGLLARARREGQPEGAVGDILRAHESIKLCHNHTRALRAPVLEARCGQGRAGRAGGISLDNLVFCGHWAAFAARLKAVSSRQVPQKQTT